MTSLSCVLSALRKQGLSVFSVLTRSPEPLGAKPMRSELGCQTEATGQARLLWCTYHYNVSFENSAQAEQCCRMALYPSVRPSPMQQVHQVHRQMHVCTHMCIHACILTKMQVSAQPHAHTHAYTFTFPSPALPFIQTHIPCGNHRPLQHCCSYL